MYNFKRYILLPITEIVILVSLKPYILLFLVHFLALKTLNFRNGLVLGKYGYICSGYIYTLLELIIARTHYFGIYIHF